MVHNLWCTSQDCLNLSQLVLHLRTRINLTKDVVNRIASYLKLPRLNILARTDMYVSNKIRYAFWDTTCPPFEFCRDDFEVGEEEGQLIACDFRFQVLAFAWEDGSLHTVKVVSKHRQQDITNVIGPSAAFSSDGITFAVPVFISGNACIAVYHVIHNPDSLLSDRIKIFWPAQAVLLVARRFIPMSFSPNAETLAFAGEGQIFFVDLIGQSFSGCTQRYDTFDISAVQYSPDGRFVAAAGNDLHSDYRIKFYGFIYMFDDMGNNLWKLASDSTGGRLLGIDALSFSPCSTKIACTNQSTDDARLYIVDINSGRAHMLRVLDPVWYVAFDPSAQRLITVHSSSICILDIMSGAKLHEALFFDSSLTIEAISWPEDNREDD